MRTLTVGAVVISAFLAACAHAQGCLSESPQDCLRNAENSGFRLSRNYPDNTIDSQLAGSTQVDVNGHRIARDTHISLVGTIRGESGVHTLGIMVGENGLVISASITLAGNPLLAQAASEYAVTGLYPATRILFGSVCAASPLEVYRFFENTVKPSVVWHKKETDFTDRGASTTSMQDATNVPFCGEKLDFMSESGVDTEQISYRNPDGIYQVETLTAHT